MGKPGLGAQVLDQIADTLLADSAVRWVEGGFDWTPGSHLVRVRAFPSSAPTSQGRWRITFETDSGEIHNLDLEDYH